MPKKRLTGMAKYAEDGGMDTAVADKAVKTRTPKAVRQARIDMQRLRAQSLEIAEDLKLGLMSADRDAKVRKLIDHYLDKGIKLKEIKGSDALGAAKLYSERRWPARSEAPAPAKTFIQTNLNIFLPDPQPTVAESLGAPVDTTYSVLDDGKQTTDENPNEFKKTNVR